MITLTTKDFTNLLHDIYQIYAPTKLEGIEQLIAKYDGEYVSQRNAIQMAYILFNKPNNPNYNSEAGTETYITKLMEQYARGERIISQESLQEQKDRARREAEQAALEQQKAAEQKAKEEEERKTKEEEEKIKALEKFKGSTEEQLQKLEEIEKLKQLIEKQDEYIKRQSENLKKNIVSSGSLFSEIMVECDVPIVFPGGNDYLVTLSIGQRMIYQHPDTGELIGLEVEDINDDLFSSMDKRPIRIMKIKRV